MVSASMPFTEVWLNEVTLVDVNGVDIVEVSKLAAEDNTGGSADEVLNGRMVLGKSTIVVGKSKVLFCIDSVVYRNVVLVGNVTL